MNTLQQLHIERFPRAQRVLCYDYSSRPVEINARIFFCRNWPTERIRFVKPEQIPTRWPAIDNQAEPDKWRTCTELEHNQHIGAHIKPRPLAENGLPAYDIEVSVARGFSPEPVIQNIYEKLERTDGELMKEINAHKTRSCELSPCAACEMSVIDYKIKLVKILLYIEEKYMQEGKSVIIDWNRVAKVFQNPKELKVDLMKDAWEGTFFFYAAVIE